MQYFEFIRATTVGSATAAHFAITVHFTTAEGSTIT